MLSLAQCADQNFFPKHIYCTVINTIYRSLIVIEKDYALYKSSKTIMLCITQFVLCDF